MRQAIVHFGLPKTGTSALQSFLDLASDRLLRHGFYYFKTQFPAGSIHSGNGGALFAHSLNKNRSDLDISLSPLMGPDGTISIISCELYCHLDDESLQLLTSSLSSIFDRISYIGYVRSLSSLYYSEYTQSLKRHGETRSVTQFICQQSLRSCSFPKRLQEYIRPADEIRLLKYPNNDSFCISSDFVHILGVPELGSSRVALNRSLTPFEATLFRFLNIYLRGFADSKINLARISDQYLRLQPTSIARHAFLSRENIATIYNRHEDDLHYLNQCLGSESALMTMDQELSVLDSMQALMDCEGLLLDESEAVNISRVSALLSCVQTDVNELIAAQGKRYMVPPE